MLEPLLAICAALLAAILVVLLLRRAAAGTHEKSLETALERTERTMRDDIGRHRQEMSGAIDTLKESLLARLGGIDDMLDSRLRAIHEQSLQDAKRAATDLRDELSRSLSDLQKDNSRQIEAFRTAMVDRHETAAKATEQSLEQVRATVDGRLKSIQDDFGNGLLQLRQDSTTAAKEMRGELQQSIAALRDENTKQLDKMRLTVDEHLQSTLEKRLGESFRRVSEQLERVYRGLGEMQELATGVRDLKNVLTNVSARGKWGEVQLGEMLEQVLPKQFRRNVSPKGNAERVEFAVVLPGAGGDVDEPVLLPIDSKFPTADYEKLVEAREKADEAAVDAAGKRLAASIKQNAADIRDKYVYPPATTDFAIMYLPTEGLFAEVIRRQELVDYAQQQCRVVIAGPTTLWALLTSLQIGFRTLAIQKRSGEVWTLLAEIKTEWGKYADALDKVRRKLDEARSSIDKVDTRHRVLNKKLNAVGDVHAAGALADDLFDAADASEDPPPASRDSGNGVVAAGGSHADDAAS